MHSALVRVQNVFGFFTTVVSFLAGFIALSVLVLPPSPTATLTMRNVQMYVSPLLRGPVLSPAPVAALHCRKRNGIGASAAWQERC
jgi:hypothetical protein